MTTKNDETEKTDEAPEKITQEEFAHILYKRDVIHDAWDKEQDSHKAGYLNAARTLITRLQNAGYDIIKRQPQKK
jgi:hypothetical protein